jgi:membrane associated rhomboid family serine protease
VQQQQRPPLQAIHVLLACLVLVWLAGTAGLLPPAQLVLDPSRARWTSLLTDAFACTSSQLLARNAFLVYVFGRVVQNTEGGAAVWCVFLLSALGELHVSQRCACMRPVPCLT